ncbi:MAG: oligosaccharide flippase family protein [Pseudomonadota bacterium]
MMLNLSHLHDKARAFLGDSSSLRGKVFQSASWVSAGYVAEMVLRLGSSLILTRLLSPAAFGIMATAQVFLYTAIMLSDVGIRSLVITNERSDDPEFLRTVWTFQIVRGVVLATIVALLGQGLGVAQRLGYLAPQNSFADPMLPAIIAALGVTLAFAGLNSTNEHVMARDLRQDILVKLETSTKILSTFITVGAVWTTRSVWGFVYAALIVAVLRAVLSMLIVPGPRMTFAWNRNDIHYLINRGKWIGVSSWATLARNLADKVLIGSFFGSSVLGLYALALTLSDALHSLMEKATKAIALPVLVEMLRTKKPNVMKIFFQIRGSIFLGSACIGVSIFSLSSFIVEVIYDPRYNESGLVLAALSLKYFIFHFLINLEFMRARGNFAYVAFFQVISSVLLWVFAIILALEMQLTLVVVAFAISPLVERGLASGWLIRNGLLNLKIELMYYLVTAVFLVLCFINLSPVSASLVQ